MSEPMTDVLLDMLRNQIMADEVRIQELEKISRRLDKAKELLRVLVADESTHVPLREAVTLVFQNNGNRPLSIPEVMKAMEGVGWVTNVKKPKTAIRCFLSRSGKFERTERGVYRLATNGSGSPQTEIGVYDTR